MEWWPSQLEADEYMQKLVVPFSFSHLLLLKPFTIRRYWKSLSRVGWIGQKETSAGLAASICSPGDHGVLQSTLMTAGLKVLGRLEIQVPNQVVCE